MMIALSRVLYGSLFYLSKHHSFNHLEDFKILYLLKLFLHMLSVWGKNWNTHKFMKLTLEVITKKNIRIGSINHIQSEELSKLNLWTYMQIKLITVIDLFFMISLFGFTNHSSFSKLITSVRGMWTNALGSSNQQRQFITSK